MSPNIAIGDTVGTEGIITITYNSTNLPELPAGSETIVLSPFVRGTDAGGAAFSGEMNTVTNQSGAVDWACASAGETTANNKGLDPATLGTVPVKYAPSECR